MPDLDVGCIDVDVATGELSDDLPVILEGSAPGPTVLQRLLAVRGCVLRMGIKGLAAYNAGKFVLSATLGWKAAKFLTELGLDQIEAATQGSDFLGREELLIGFVQIREFLTHMAVLENDNQLLYRSLAGLIMVATSASFWVMLGGLGVRRFYKREIAEENAAE